MEFIWDLQNIPEKNVYILLLGYSSFFAYEVESMLLRYKGEEVTFTKSCLNIIINKASALTCNILVVLYVHFHLY